MAEGGDELPEEAWREITVAQGSQKPRSYLFCALDLGMREVAELPGISYHTARKHRQNLVRKLGARTPADLLTAARNFGLL